MLEKPDSVRIATPADEQALFDLLLALHREGLGSRFPYDFEKVMTQIQHGTQGRGGMIGVIDGRPGYLAGSVKINVTEWWWSRDCYGLELWCYVRPEYRRGTGYFQALKRWSEECRATIDRDPEKKQTSPFVLDASFVNGDPRQVRLMERLWGRFGRKIGSTFLSGM